MAKERPNRELSDRGRDLRVSLSCSGGEDCCSLEAKVQYALQKELQPTQSCQTRYKASESTLPEAKDRSIED